MNRKHKLIMPTPEEDAAIQRGIEADEDAFELSDEDFARMKPTAEVFPDILEAHKAGRLRARGGRPRKANPKRSVSIRLDQKIIDFFKAGSENGRGWQTRLHQALEEYVRTHKA